MAALDGKITIERELRPCMVKIPKRVKKHIAKPANTTMISVGYALIQKHMIEQTLQIMSINVTVGRTGRTIHAKRRFEELDTGTNER